MRKNSPAKAAAGSRRVSLRVLRSGGKPTARPNGVSRWRAGVMIGVYVLMIGHVVHWSVTGRSVNRFVLSDSMRTLEMGEVNPGFVLFALALLVTLVCGRFLCGWACHMAGLQDLCAWLLRKAGVRPRLFRSRALGYIPVGLALYMFVWPSVKRLAVTPGDAPAVPPLSVRMTTAELWEGLPSWGIAVPFLLVCGFATVYFLGARGLCRYGCPYGGLFLPAEQLAPVRIVVDMAKCDQCGLCTSACTSGVRVHDQVRLMGMVADRNCVRSMDCVAACPSGALRLGLAVPPALTRGKPPEARVRYDLAWWEEGLVAGVFLAALAVLRGLYGAVPLLMAATLAVLAAFLAWKCLRLTWDRDVRLGFAQVRRAGRLTGAGAVFVGAALLAAVFLAHSAVVRGCLWWGARFDDRVTVSLDAVLTDRGAAVPEEEREHARRALAWYARGLSWRRGGMALADTPETVTRLAWLRLVAGDWSGAEAALRERLANDADTDAAAANLARLLIATERREEAERVLVGAMEGKKSCAQSRELACWLWVSGGRGELAERAYRTALDRDPDDVACRAGLGRLLLMLERPGEAVEVLGPAAAAWPRAVNVRSDHAVALFMRSGVDAALRELSDAAAAEPRAAGHYAGLGASLLRRAGRGGEAGAWEAGVIGAGRGGG